MANLNISLPSDVTSSIIGTSSEAMVTPAVNLTEYGPEL